MTGENHRDLCRGARLTQWLKAFARQTRGNVAMMFGMALPLLLMISLGAIDIHQASRVKANLQDALDAAALAAARSNFVAASDIQRVGMDSLRANMPDYYKAGSGDTATFVLENNVLVADAKVNVKVLVANIVLPPYGKLLDDFLPVSTSSSVLRASRNVEVGLALDITESMRGAPLLALKAAATELVGIVVQQQTPFYSVMGIVPYSASVNLGTTLGPAARGPIRGTTSIASGEYFGDVTKSITTITKASQAVITVTNHRLQNGDRVRIESVGGMTSLNNKVYIVSDRATDTFKIKNDNGAYISTSSLSNYSGSGKIRECIDKTCGLVLRSVNHGLLDGEAVLIRGMETVTTFNNTSRTIKLIDQDRFMIVGSSYSSNLPADNKGTVQCLSTGCAKYQFASKDGTSTLDVSNCVTERTGAQAYTDAAPAAGRYFGLMYPGTKGRAVCPTSTVLPLTSDTALLNDKIANLSDAGVTAGQIGLAWAWNLVSPNFNEFWGTGVPPGVRDDDKTLKVVILMTDGEFNTNYCTGVVASDAPGRTSVSDNKSVMDNCKATNGNPITQARSLCTAMKAEGIIVYTVGFDLNDATATAMLQHCATTVANHYHSAVTATELRNAFRAIGHDITRLRLAR